MNSVSAPSWTTLAVLVGSAGSTIATTESAEVSTHDACFYSYEVGSDVRKGCELDPLNVASRHEIKAALDALSLKDVHLTFKGCAKASFATAVTGPDAQRLRFVVYYPTTGTEVDSIISPLLHEIGHVYQLRNSGSAANLLESASIVKVELGADFLTGVIAGHVINSLPVKFQENLELVGRYRKFSIQAHGTPEQRMAAFRRGFFLQPDEYSNGIQKNYEFFNEEYFYEIHEVEE